MTEYKGHAFRNPSSASQWLECAKWAEFKREDPDPFHTAGAAAARGTMLHERLENALTTGEAIMNHAKGLDEHDTAMLVMAHEMMCELIHDHEIEHYQAEVSVTLTYEPDARGTIDLLGVAKYKRRILIADAKFGREHVPVENNVQLMLYAAMALVSLRKKEIVNHNTHEVVLAIVQPESGDEPDVQIFCPDDLDRFRIYVEQVVARQEAGEDTRGAGSPKTCTWCPAKMACPTAGRMMDEAMDAGLDIVEGRANQRTIQRFFEARAMIEDAIKMARETIIKDEENFPGWKRIERKNARKWDPTLDEEEIAHQLRREYDITNPYRLRTVGDILKEIGKDAEIDGMLTPASTHTLLKALK